MIVVHVTMVTKEIHRLLPGEMTCDERNHRWYIGCPNPLCKGVGNLGGHTVTMSENLVTVSPSILCGCGAHYFIERSQIRWVEGYRVFC